MALFNVRDTRTRDDGLFLLPWTHARLKYLARFKKQHMFTAHFTHCRDTVTRDDYSVTVPALKVHFNMFPCRVISLGPVARKNSVTMHEDRFTDASSAAVQNSFLSMNMLERLGFDLAIVHFYIGNYVVIESHQDDAYAFYYVGLSERERVIQMKYHTRLERGILH